MADNVTPIKGKPRKAPAKKPSTELTPIVERGSVEHELKLAGKSWSEIAKIQNHSSPKAAYHARERYLERARLALSQERRAQALELEVERLDTLQASYWQAAIVGHADPDTGICRPDLRAAEFVLKVIGQRAKLLGLDEADQVQQGPRTVLVTGNSEAYIATLKQLVAGEIVDAELAGDDQGHD